MIIMIIIMIIMIMIMIYNIIRGPRGADRRLEEVQRGGADTRGAGSRHIIL